MTSTEWTSSLTVAGRFPMDRSALFAVPMPRKVRPGASMFKVAIEFAVTGAIRVSGLVTIVPRLIVEVFCDASAICWYGSENSSGPSPTPKWVTPRSSACLMRSTWSILAQVPIQKSI